MSSAQYVALKWAQEHPLDPESSQISITSITVRSYRPQ
jgi:hypothetical protein